MRSALIVLLIGLTSLEVGLSTAQAHDKWADGSTVPAWVKAECCGPEDVHHLDPSEVHQVQGGYSIDGYPDVVPYARALPSMDGDYWIFYKVTDTSSGPHFSPVYCFFVPMGA